MNAVLLIMAFVLSGPPSPGIVINEFMVDQRNTIKDPDFGEYAGWIELHNRSNKKVAIGGWILAGNSPETHPEMTDVIPEGMSIEPGGYLVIWADGRGVKKKAFHTRFKLSPHGGKAALYRPANAASVSADSGPYVPVNDRPNASADSRSHVPADDNPDESAGVSPVLADFRSYGMVDAIFYKKTDVAPDISIGRMTFGGYDDHPGFVLPMNVPTPGVENRLTRLKLLESHVLEIEDPSGLGVDHTGKYLWTVSDMRGGSIYKITKKGEIIDKLEVNGDDMEGISQHPHSRILYVAEEKMRTIVQYDTLGNKIRSDSVAVDVRRRNRGLEGITINPVNNHVFVVNKMTPRVLIELDLSKEKEKQQVRFTPVHFGGIEDNRGDSDDDSRGLSLAGLHFDGEDEVLWVVSDRAQAVFVLDMLGRPLAAYDAAEDDLEAIAVIREENRIYLVSDTHHTLHVFEFPDPMTRLPAQK